MKKYKLIIFDFDGVLVDSLEYGLELERKMDPDITLAEYRRYFDGNYFRHRKKLKPQANEIDKKRDREHYNLMQKLKIKASRKKIVKNLAEKYPIVINTSSPSFSVKNILKKNNLDKYIKNVYGRDVAYDKTKKFKLILKYYKLKKEEAIFITDTLGDLEEAEEMGIDTLAVTGGFSTVSKLKKGKSIAIIDNLTETSNFIE